MTHILKKISFSSRKLNSRLLIINHCLLLALWHHQTSYPSFFVEIFGCVTNECSWIISKSSLAPFTNWNQVLTHCIKNCCATGPTIIKKFSKKGPLRNKLINDRQCSCFMIYLKVPEQYFWIIPFFFLYYYTKWNFEYF